IGNALTGVDPYIVATIRLGCASLLFLPFLITHDISVRDRGRLILYGAVQFGLMYSLYMRAFYYIPSHLVAIFSILTPVYVVLINDIRQRKFSWRYLLVAILSVLGAGIIKAKELPSGDIWIGFMLMQGAGLAFAFGQVAYRDWKYKNWQINDRNVFSLLTIGGTICAACFSSLFTDWSTLEINLEQWKSILYLGFIASGLGFFLWNKGATQSNTGTLAACNNAVVPLAVICSLFFFGEIKNIDTDALLTLFAGSILIFGAVIIGQKISRRKT
uniref:EamA family transporter n=1 Tax=Candidatus Seribacter sulfatis TaxID=3381756 RepID=UPI00389A6FE9